MKGFSKESVRKIKGFSKNAFAEMKAFSKEVGKRAISLGGQDSSLFTAFRGPPMQDVLNF